MKKLFLRFSVFIFCAIVLFGITLLSRDNVVPTAHAESAHSQTTVAKAVSADLLNPGDFDGRNFFFTLTSSCDCGTLNVEAQLHYQYTDNNGYYQGYVDLSQDANNMWDDTGGSWSYDPVTGYFSINFPLYGDVGSYNLTGTLSSSIMISGSGFYSGVDVGTWTSIG